MSVNWKLNLMFEFTGSYTSQQNHFADVKFHTIANCGLAIMNKANVPKKSRYILWQDSLMTATLLDGLITS
jgi:hypothetical protein